MLIPVGPIRSNRMEPLPPPRLADTYIPVPERVSATHAAATLIYVPKLHALRYGTPTSNNVAFGELRLHHISTFRGELNGFGPLENFTISTRWKAN